MIGRQSPSNEPTNIERTAYRVVAGVPVRGCVVSHRVQRFEPAASLFSEFFNKIFQSSSAPQNGQKARNVPTSRQHKACVEELVVVDIPPSPNFYSLCPKKLTLVFGEVKRF
jgi:hypothetical protein